MKQAILIFVFITKDSFSDLFNQFARFIFHEILKTFFKLICFFYSMGDTALESYNATYSSILWGWTNRNCILAGKTEIFLLFRKMSFSYVWCLCTMIPLGKIMSLNQRHLLIFPFLRRKSALCFMQIPPSNETGTLPISIKDRLSYACALICSSDKLSKI